jgi:RHS repeat-associated protein
LEKNNTVLRSYLWGNDRSGTMGGAGGVGGLLAMRVHSGTNTGSYFYAYDGNGNVVGLVNATNGAIAAQYEYGPFGELIRATGPLARENPFLFSTKFYDWESELYYYGYRSYNPSSGRWLSRDAVGEEGGLNLYAFVANGPISHCDSLGHEISHPDRLPTLYDSCCCDEYGRRIGLDKLKERYGLAKNYLDSNGAVPDPYENGPGHISCFDAAVAILGFMEPTPSCWICYIENRREHKIVWDGRPRWGWDENAVVCVSFTPARAPAQKVVFDWFNSRVKGWGPAEPYDKFLREYPVFKGYYDSGLSKPKYNDCWVEDYPGHRWYADFEILDAYLE